MARTATLAQTAEGRLTGPGGAGCGGGEAVVVGGVPGDTAAPAPQAADPGARAHTGALLQEGLAAGGPVHQHVVQQHAGEPSEHVHGPGERHGDRHLIFTHSYTSGTIWRHSNGASETNVKLNTDGTVNRNTVIEKLAVFKGRH